MALKTHKLAAATAVAAAFSLLAMPVAAVELPRPAAVKAYDGEGLNVERDRRRRWHRDRDDIDAGDVVAGVVLLGAIAAIAGAAKKNRDRDRYEELPPPPEAGDDYGYRTPGAYERNDGRGIDRAVDMCVGEVERGQDRVETVDGANRTGEGWTVSGALEGGAGFTCRIDNMGRIRAIDIGGERAAFEPADNNQYADDVYAHAREAQGGTYAEPGVAPSGEEDTRPEWTGDTVASQETGDGRYSASQAPDFEQGS